MVRPRPAVPERIGSDTSPVAEVRNLTRVEAMERARLLDVTGCS
jgi:hypothetical protein